MKRIWFAAALAVALTAALAATGCKSRDVKGLALGLGPVPVAAPGKAPCQRLAASYSLSGVGCWGYYSDTTDEGDEGGPYTECGFGEYDTYYPQKIYEVTIDHADYLYVHVVSGDEVGISLRRNCNPGGNEADIIDCDVNYETEASVGAYLPAGTYYFVIDNLCCPDEPYDYEICVGAV